MTDMEEEDAPKASAAGKYTEFDCPECSANNPMGDGFKAGDEIRCNYCGEAFDVAVRDDGRLRLKLR